MLHETTTGNLGRSIRLLSLAIVLVGGCEHGSDGKISGYKACDRDAECPGGQVCDLDDPQDGYCTPGCSSDETCPTQVSCPSLEPVGQKCWLTNDANGVERGVCDQFQGYYGPNSCRESEPSDDECIPNGNACGPSNTYVAACCSGFCGDHGTCGSD